MPATVDYQRQLHRQAYGASMVSNLERLATGKSEYIRLNALKQLARIIGIVSLLPQLHDLALNARSEWICYQATIVIIDYLQLGSDEAADNRPEPLSLDLNEQLAVQQHRLDTADPLTHPQPPAPINYTADYLDPPLDDPYRPTPAARPAIATPDAAAATLADDQPTDAGHDTIVVNQLTDDNTAADQPEQSDNQHDADDPVAAYETDEIKHLFEQGERLAERLNQARDAAEQPPDDPTTQPNDRPPPT